MKRTVGTLIKAGMRKAAILAGGEPLSARDGVPALEAFQEMVDDWSTDQLLIPAVSDISFGLMAGEGDYTIGIFPTAAPFPDNHFETPRPQEILSAFIRDGNGTDYDLEPISVSQYNIIDRKGNAARPWRMYIQKGWPLNTLHFNALPYEDDTLHLSCLQPLSAFIGTMTMDTIVDLPPGYNTALIYGGAIRYLDEWSKPIKPNVARIAANTLKKIKRNNSRMTMLRTDKGLLTRRRGYGTYRILSGPG